MNTSELIASIDAEISRLQQARELLAVMTLREAIEPQRRAKRKRTMSAEGRARISAAPKEEMGAAEERGQVSAICDEKPVHFCAILTG